MRTKVSYLASESLNESLPLDHPTLGSATVHLVYERATRLCAYYAYIGHDISRCPTRARVLQLCADPAYSNRYELAILRDHRKGSWMNCSALVPCRATDSFPTNAAPVAATHVQQPPLASPAATPPYPSLTAALMHLIS